MKKIMRLLIPKQNMFFELLEEQAKNMVTGAAELKEFIDSYSELGISERRSRAQSIKSIEKKGDEIAREILERLEKNAAAPFESDEIRQITMLLDDIIDLINTTSSRFFVLSIARADSYIIKLADAAISIVNEVGNAIPNLKKLKLIKEHCEKIYMLENKADEIYNEALSELFHFYKNSIDIMKHRDIYELLEQIADKCKDIADVFESLANRY